MFLLNYLVLYFEFSLFQIYVNYCIVHLVKNKTFQVSFTNAKLSLCNQLFFFIENFRRFVFIQISALKIQVQETSL